MSMSLLARLFAVPFLIVSLIVGCAVVVVLLFGSITTEQQRSVDQLLLVLEREPSGKLFDLAMTPHDKEIWQAAKELAARIQRKDVEMTDADLDRVVARLSELVDRDLKRPRVSGPNRLDPLHFFIAALAHSGRSEALPPVLRCLSAEDWRTRREAIKALAETHRNPGVSETAVRVAELLDDPEPTVRVMAAYALTFLGGRDEPAIVARLTQACDSPGEDREVRWNAALTLARWGHPSAKNLLLEMLERDYWEKRTPIRLEGPSGVIEQPMPAAQADRILAATVEAAANLTGDDVWRAISRLEGDRSLVVQEAVRLATSKRKATVVP